MSDVVDEGYDDLLDAVEAGEPYYLECANGHGLLPPRRICPRCGSRELAERALPEAGEIVTSTVVRVATPQFADDVPYVTAIADFGPVSLTGQLRGVEPDPEAVEAVETVGVGIGESATTGQRLLVFEPR